MAQQQRSFLDAYLESLPTIVLSEKRRQVFEEIYQTKFGICFNPNETDFIEEYAVFHYFPAALLPPKFTPLVDAWQDYFDQVYVTPLVKHFSPDFLKKLDVAKRQIDSLKFTLNESELTDTLFQHLNVWIARDKNTPFVRFDYQSTLSTIDQVNKLAGELRINLEFFFLFYDEICRFLTDPSALHEWDIVETSFQSTRGILPDKLVENMFRLTSLFHEESIEFVTHGLCLIFLYTWRSSLFGLNTLSPDEDYPDIINLLDNPQSYSESDDGDDAGSEADPISASSESSGSASINSNGTVTRHATNPKRTHDDIEESVEDDDDDDTGGSSHDAKRQCIFVLPVTNRPLVEFDVRLTPPHPPIPEPDDGRPKYYEHRYWTDSMGVAEYEARIRERAVELAKTPYEDTIREQVAYQLDRAKVLREQDEQDEQARFDGLYNWQEGTPVCHSSARLLDAAAKELKQVRAEMKERSDQERREREAMEAKDDARRERLYLMGLRDYPDPLT